MKRKAGSGRGRCGDCRLSPVDLADGEAATPLKAHAPGAFRAFAHRCHVTHDYTYLPCLPTRFDSSLLIYRFDSMAINSFIFPPGSAPSRSNAVRAAPKYINIILKQKKAKSQNERRARTRTLIKTTDLYMFPPAVRVRGRSDNGDKHT